MAKKLAFDKVLFTTVVLLVFFGLVMVYSASAALSRNHGLGHFLVKQSLAAGLGLLLMAWLMHVDYRRLREPAVIYTLLGLCLMLLVAVLFSPQLNATRRWFFLAGISVQPSELAKLALIPFLAYQIEKKEEQVNKLSFLLPAGFFTALTASLILLEPDMGTAVLLCATFFLMIFMAGLSWRYILAALAVVPPLLGALVMMEPYRRQRLFAFLDPEKDPLGSGFQALQSLIAVGSGGVFGLGPGKSMQKLFFLPHPESDFIFFHRRRGAGDDRRPGRRRRLRRPRLARPRRRRQGARRFRSLPRLGAHRRAGHPGPAQRQRQRGAVAHEGDSASLHLLWRLVAGGHPVHLRRPPKPFAARMIGDR